MLSHIAVFDIGKTNKKCLVFDENYRVVFETASSLPQSADEDGEPCEDIFLLKKWISETLAGVLADPRFQIRAVNCATYGATFVHLDADGQPLAPIYNYLKPFPADLQKRFFEQHGDPAALALETASPLLGMLNSGLQLYWLKHCRSAIFEKIKCSLHLPQWVSSVVFSCLQAAGQAAPEPVAELTSIGCHTMLWDFAKRRYHAWVEAEGIAAKLPPISSEALLGAAAGLKIGAGLHDSSAALIPYLAAFREPFLLLSTGTWCISLNPFNAEPLTPAELAQDCLCYCTRGGRPVKAARYFGGHEHEQAVRRLAVEFGAADDFYRSPDCGGHAILASRYADFMRQLIERQAISTRLALGRSAPRQLFVDGGFSKNKHFMHGLRAAFPAMEVRAAEVAQATALGAALALHDAWNAGPISPDLVKLR